MGTTSNNIRNKNVFSKNVLCFKGARSSRLINNMNEASSIWSLGNRTIFLTSSARHKTKGGFDELTACCSTSAYGAEEYTFKEGSRWGWDMKYGR
jgi:hypothetical protein